MTVSPTPTIAPTATVVPSTDVIAEVTQKVDSVWILILPYIKNIGLAILYVVLGFIAIGFIKRTLKNFCKKSKRIDKALAQFMVSGVDIVLKILLFIGILSTLGVETASIVAVLGAASLAIGIALQGALSNFASGVMLMVFKPYKADDYIECNDYSGTVYDVNIFSTQLQTIDNKIITIPNSKMVTDPLINYTANEYRRVDITVGVDYDSNIDQVKSVLNSIMQSHSKILPTPEPVARVMELGESSIDFIIRAWTKGEDYWDVRFDLNETIKKTFDRHKISIPYPHITIVEKEKN
jgi:small conductance mechanosensitive channel